MNLKLGEKSIPAQRVFCVGMNYTEHIQELSGKIPNQPVIFMKPAHSIALPGKKLRFPDHGQDLNYETELVLLIGRQGRVSSPSEAISFIQGITLGFDLTLRDIQKKLKQDGHPWELSKSFEDSAAIGNFIEFHSSINLESIEFEGYVNDELRQKGNTSQMIFPVENLVHYIGSVWEFIPGDVIFTGTPPGVGSLKKSERIRARSSGLSLDFSWEFSTGP